MDLDDLDYFRSIDSQNYLRHIDALPDQVAAAWALGRALSLPVAQSDRAAGHVVIVGRGDSAIAGDLARTVALPESRLPVTLWQEAALPAFVGPETVVVALSHSGDTPETVAAAEAALARGAQLLAVTAGGQLAALAGASGAAWRYPAEGDSRAAVGYLALLTLAALAQVGAVTDRSADVAEAVEALKGQQAGLRADSPVHHNPAKRMAGQLIERYAALFVVDELAPAGRRWQGQINQLAKAWAQCVPLAEADHAIAGRMFPEALVPKFMALFLQGSGPSARADAARHAFMTSGFNTDAIAATGRSPLAQMLTLMHYGDYTAYYLAMWYGIDPGPIPNSPSP